MDIYFTDGKKQYRKAMTDYWRETFIVEINKTKTGFKITDGKQVISDEDKLVKIMNNKSFMNTYGAKISLTYEGAPPDYEFTPNELLEKLQRQGNPSINIKCK